MARLKRTRTLAFLLRGRPAQEVSAGNAQLHQLLTLDLDEISIKKVLSTMLSSGFYAILGF